MYVISACFYLNMAQGFTSAQPTLENIPSRHPPSEQYPVINIQILTNNPCTNKTPSLPPPKTKHLQESLLTPLDIFLTLANLQPYSDTIQTPTSHPPYIFNNPDSVHTLPIISSKMWSCRLIEFCVLSPT